MNFQRICIIIASILLVILFCIIAVSFNASYSNSVWPPIIANCPDYWDDVNGDGTACMNVKGLGDVPKNTIVNFYNDHTTACDKYNYCIDNNISWDGISYGYGATSPCENT